MSYILLTLEQRRTLNSTTSSFCTRTELLTSALQERNSFNMRIGDSKWHILIAFYLNVLFYRRKCAAFHVSSFVSNTLHSTNNVKTRWFHPSIVSLNMQTIINVDHLLNEGQRAANEWDIFVTPFLNEEDGQLLEERLRSRGDVGYMRIGGNGFSSPLRTRFVMSNTDLELDVKVVNEDYCTILCVHHVDTASMSGQSPWPHLLNQIGVGLEYVGDVIVEDDKAYMAVDPTVTKQCCRLLPKEMRGVGITVSIVDQEDYLPKDGVKVSMQLGRLDKRALKYK